MNYTIILLEGFATIITVVLLIANLMSKKIYKQLDTNLLLLILNHVCLLLSDMGIGLIRGNTETVVWLKILWILNYVFFVLDITFLTFYMVSFISKKTKVPMWIKGFVVFVAVISIVLWFSSMFTNDIYMIDKNGEFTYCKGYIVTQISSASFAIIDILILVRYINVLTFKKSIVWMFYVLFPISMFPLDIKYDSAPVYLAMTIDILVIYVVINMELEQKYMEKELALSESRNKLMVSQIQPHFIFNSLTSIAQLCCDDSQKAYETTIAFSDYLRINMESLNQIKCVPFERELDHLKTYLEIEKVRYEDNLNIEYDLQITDFQVPSLSIQPIVENAIKHGVSKKEDGGTVKISTKESEKIIEIIISDDGVGYDTAKKLSKDRQHVGIANVKNRLHIMCDGTLTTESEIGVGTVVTIKIPKENTNEYYSS